MRECPDVVDHGFDTKVPVIGEQCHLGGRACVHVMKVAATIQDIVVVALLILNVFGQLLSPYSPALQGLYEFIFQVLDGCSRFITQINFTSSSVVRL